MSTSPILRKLEALDAVLVGTQHLLVVMQNYPDPDALAAAAALRELARSRGVHGVSVASGGELGRAENRALARYLRLNLENLDLLDLTRFDRLAMVDTQPRTGNNALPPDAVPHIVLDHHPLRQATRAATFYDVRRTYGATCTLLYEYLTAAKVELQPILITGLVYGIRSDTHDLGRDTSRADIAALVALYPRADHRALGAIQAAKTPRSYFHAIARALVSARVYGDTILSFMGEIETPDIVGELADLLLRDEKSAWTLVYGVFDDRLLLSLRTSERQRDAGQIMHRLVDGLGTGGGHNAMAGGQIPLPEDSPARRAQLEAELKRRLLRALHIRDRKGVPLIQT
ncbi:MAG: DHHA1 domain-containing protein [Pseudomonadota bacterium]